MQSVGASDEATWKSLENKDESGVNMQVSLGGAQYKPPTGSPKIQGRAGDSRKPITRPKKPGNPRHQGPLEHSRKITQKPPQQPLVRGVGRAGLKTDLRGGDCKTGA